MRPRGELWGRGSGGGRPAAPLPPLRGSAPPPQLVGKRTLPPNGPRRLQPPPPPPPELGLGRERGSTQSILCLGWTPDDSHTPTPPAARDTSQHRRFPRLSIPALSSGLGVPRPASGPRAPPGDGGESLGVKDSVSQRDGRLKPLRMMILPLAHWKPATEIAGIQLLITSLEMRDGPRWGLAKSFQGPQSSVPSRYLLLRGTLVVSEANQDNSYTGMASTCVLKKHQGSSGGFFTGYKVCKGQLKQLK